MRAIRTILFILIGIPMGALFGTGFAFGLDGTATMLPVIAPTDIVDWFLPLFMGLLILLGTWNDGWKDHIFAVRKLLAGGPVAFFEWFLLGMLVCIVVVFFTMHRQPYTLGIMLGELALMSAWAIGNLMLQSWDNPDPGDESDNGPYLRRSAK